MSDAHLSPYAPKYEFDGKPLSRNAKRRVAGRQRAYLATKTLCEWCEGDGYDVEPRPCAHCHGTGFQLRAGDAIPSDNSNS